MSSISDSLSFLSAGDSLGTMIRGFDWAETPLGAPQNWPQSLKTAVGIMLSSKFPMFVAWGPELRFLYNDGYAEVLGGKHPAALGSRFEEIWSEIWPDIGPIVDRALAGEATYWKDLPLVLKRKGYQEQTWFTFSYSPLRDDEGVVTGMFCACVETTDSVLAEQRRIDEAKRLEQLFDHAPSFMAVLRGPEFVFEMMNHAYLQLVGHRNLIGKPVREALPEIEGQGFFELLDEVYRSGKPFTGRSMKIQLQRTPDAPAEERLLDFVFQPIVDGDGRVGAVFAEGYDVTERHLAELALRESEERFRLIADSAPVPMWVTRMDGTRSFTNRAYVDFLGISDEDAIDFDWRTIIHPDDAGRILAESLAGEKSLKPFVLEGRYRCRDGTWHWLRSESQPRWGPLGEHVGFIGIAHDITDSKLAETALREVNETLEKRVAERTEDLSAALDRLQAEVGERLRAEDALRQAQKMEAVGQLTGGIAHDFNNLLTPIMGGLDIIAAKVEDPRLKRIAKTALESSRRGAKLTGQLLAFSRIQRITMAPVPVNEVIEKMESLLSHTIGGAIRIDTLLDGNLPHCVCDANQLENAILNLAINARDAMPDGGSLTISTSKVQLNDSPDVEAGDFICISVADSGEGMSAEVLARATEPFFSTKPLGKGTGLGLAQVYGITRQSGGTLRVESAVGIGTRVDLFLPAVEAGLSASEAEPQEQAAPAGHGRCATIIIVDDDRDVRSFLADSLQGLGHKVVIAEDGEDALEKLGTCTPDLMLLDYAMPLMHGGEVARKVRALHESLPIIFVTGYADTDQLEAALGPSVAMLRKPFGISELAAAVDQALKPKDAV